MLDAFAVVAFQVFNDLAGLATILVDRNADTTAGRGQGAAEQSGELACNVKKADFAEIEQVTVEGKPLVHIALVNVVGQVVQIVEANARRGFFAGPFVFFAIGVALFAVGIHEIQKAAANPVNRGNVQHFAIALVRGCAIRHGMCKGSICIHNAPCHRGCAGAMFCRETRAKAVLFGI